MTRRGAAAEYRAPQAEDVDDTVNVDGIAPLEALVRLADGDLTASDLELLQQGVDTWLNTGGAIPLERCLGLPRTHIGFHKFRRDQWLRKAASLIDAVGSTTGSQKLEAEWNKFITRGPWELWRGNYSPPDDASKLNKALFWATTHNRSESLTARHIARIVGHIFTEKCR